MGGNREAAKKGFFFLFWGLFGLADLWFHRVERVCEGLVKSGTRMDGWIGGWRVRIGMMTRWMR